MKKLRPNLGLLSVVTISISAMLGSGLFVLPGIAFTKTGPTVWLAYLLAAVAVLPASLSKAELASAMPTSGGTYVYLERTFGPLVGTIAGLGLWLSLLLKAALALVGFGAYLDVLTHINLQLTSLSLLLLIVAINIIGTGKVSKFLTVIVFITIMLITILEFGSFTHFNLDSDPLRFSHGLKGLFSATALVFVSYAGVTKVAAIAEEILEPEKNLPRGILISLFIVTLLYCSVNYILTKTFNATQLSNNLRPIYDLAVVVGGDYAGILLCVIAILCMTSMANAGVLAASRFPFAMSRDNLMPNRFGKLHKNFLTPVWSILASGMLIALAITFFNIESIAKLASAFILLVYVSENIAVIVLRETRVQWYQPKYKSPLYPLNQIFGIACGGALLFYIGGSVLFQCIVVIVVPAIIFYFFYGKRNSSRLGVLGIRSPKRALEGDEEKPKSLTSLEERIKKIPSLDLTEDARVVVSLFGKERSPEMLIEMGAGLARKERLEVAHLTEVPEQTELEDFADEPSILHSLRRRVLAMAMENQVPVTFDPIVSYDIIKTIHTLGTRLHCEWMLVEYGGRTTGAFTLHNPIGWLRDHLDCHLGIFRDAGVRYFRKIMVLVKDMDNDFFPMVTAANLCMVNKASMTLVRYIGDFNGQEHFAEKEKDLVELKEKFINQYNISSGQARHVNTKVVAGEDILQKLTDVSSEFDLMVFSIDEYLNRPWYKRFFGGLDDKLTEKAVCSVLKIRPSKTILLSPPTLEE